MSKVKIIDRRSEKSIKSERDFLSKLHHPFIVNMTCSFQDYENLYLVMDLLTGGDLRYHLCREQKFSEEETKFFFACVLLGLEYIHGNNIIHRDIKPENLVCDENGYIRITDFGVAKIMKEENRGETSGTPGYMAPEVLFGQNHNFSVDFFAIGVMGYEFMFGERPYLGKNRKEIKKLIIEKEAKIKFEDIEEGWGYESVDFINKCLKRKMSKRLGFNNGITELKNHPWFKGFNWDKLYDKKKHAPFIPKIGGNYDKKYCEAIEKITDDTKERYLKYKNQDNFGDIFNNYTFINYELIPEFFNETNTRVTTRTTNTKTSKIQNGEINYSKINNENNEKLKILLEQINSINASKSQKKKLNLDNIDSHFKLKIGKELEENIFDNHSIYKNIKYIFNNIKKLATSTKNKISNNPRNSSLNISNSNFKNNLSRNLSYTKYLNNRKNLNTKYISNNQYNLLNNSNNGSLSNQNRNKLSLKLHKSNSIFAEQISNKKNKDKISMVEFGENNNNNYINLKMSNYIRLRKNKERRKFHFDFPNINNEFKTKIKLNLDQNKLSPRKIYNINNNINIRNRYFLSPSNKELKKSGSVLSLKTPMNSNSLYNLNLAENDNNVNLYSTFARNKFKTFSKKGVLRK